MRYFLHALPNLLFPLFAKLLPQILEGQLVSVLVLTIVWRMLLDGVVGEVDKRVHQILSRVFLSCQAQIAMLVEMQLQLMSEKSPHSYIEFPV